MARWDCRHMVQASRCLLALLIGCAIARADSAPSTAATSPSTEPSGAKKKIGMPFPPQYEILLKRSIFARRTGSAIPDAAMGNARKPGMVLRGVAEQGGQRTALLEDSTSGKTSQLHVGDEASGGRIIAITMDGLDRTLAGKVLHIGVGQALDGKLDGPAPNPPQAVARENGNLATPEPASGSAMPAGAKILKMEQ